MADAPVVWSFAAVVSSSQAPNAPQPKILKQLEAHWAKPGETVTSATIEEARSCLDRVLVLGKADDATFERVAGFIAKATSVAGGSFLHAPILAHACARSLVKDRHVRARACQFIGMALACLPADADLDADVAAGITTAMLARARDKIVGVRVAAVGALMRLQDPTAGVTGCPVVAQLSWLVQHDSAKDVRAAALGALQLTADTLVQVVSHARDASAEVRICAYRKLAELVDGRLLTPAARAQLAGLGLSDAPDVRRTAVHMLAKWLADDGYDFDRFLTALNIVDAGTSPAASASAGPAPHERVAEAALFALFGFAEGPAPPSQRGAGASPSAPLALWEGSGDLAAGDPAPSRIDADTRAAALDELLPTVSDWTALLVVVADGAGISGLAVQPAAIGASTTATDEGEGGSGAADAAAAAAAMTTPAAFGVPSAIMMAATAAVAAADALTAAMLRQLLALGALLDFGDEQGRRVAAAVLAQLLAHPSMPPQLLPLANAVLVRALGCITSNVDASAPGAPLAPPPTVAYTTYASLIAGLICSARNAAELCAARDGSDSPGGGSSNARAALARLHAETDRLRVAVENAYDAASDAGPAPSDAAAGSDGDGHPAAALWQRHKALLWELADAEARISELAASLADGDAAPSAPIDCMLAGGAAAISAGQLGSLLWQRALQLSRLLLAGDGGVPGPCVQRHAARVANAVAEGLLSSPVRATGAASSTLSPALLAAHPLLACVYAPALGRGGEGEAGSDEDGATTACLALQCVALYALAQTEGYTAREVAAAFAPAMLEIAASPDYAAPLRATAATACADLVSVLGIQAAGVRPAPGVAGGAALASAGLWQRFARLLSPAAILGLSSPSAATPTASPLSGAANTFAWMPDAAPLSVQLPVARLLVRAALSGMVPAAPAPPVEGGGEDNDGTEHADLMARWPLAALAAQLHSTYYALVWRAAASDIDALAEEGSSGGDGAAAPEPESSPASIWAGVSSGDVAEALQALSQGLSALAALSPLRKAAVVAGCIVSLRGIMAVARRRGAGGDAADAPAPAPPAGRASARVAAAPPSKKALPARGAARGAPEGSEASEEDDGAASDGAVEEDSDSDAGENAGGGRAKGGKAGGGRSGKGPAPPAAPRSAVKARPLGARSVVSAAASSVGGGAFGEGGEGEAGGALLSSAAGWLANALQHVAALAGGAVLPGGAGSTAASDSCALAQAWAVLCPAMLPLPPAAAEAEAVLLPAGAEEQGLLQASDLHPACASVDRTACHIALALELAAAATADIGGFALPAPPTQPSRAAKAKASPLAPVGGTLLSTLLPALLALAPEQLAPPHAGAAAALAASVAALQKGVVTVLRSAASERTVRKVAERWACDGAGGGGLAPASAKAAQQAAAQLAGAFAAMQV